MKCLHCVLLVLAARVALAGSPAIPISLDEILGNMAKWDTARATASSQYTCIRRYTLENRRFHKTAEITARMRCTASGRKSFEILSEKGPAIIRDRVLRRMIEAEEESSRADTRPLTQISPKNYDFRLAGTEDHDGRLFYLMDIEPKTANKFLVRGKIWVDSQDFAVVRVEGSPAQSPSILIRNTTVAQRNAKHGVYWLPESNRSSTDSFLFGRTDVGIDYVEYQIAPRPSGGASGTSQ